MYVNGWPVCDGCGLQIGYEAVWTLEHGEFCTWCYHIELHYSAAESNLDSDSDSL